jgi:hypothetical protein
VVAADAGGEVGVERPAADARGVAVDDAIREGAELGGDARIPRDDAGKVHHLGQAVHDAVAEKLLEVSGGEGGAGRRHVGGGDTTRGHGDHAKGQAAAGVDHEADAGGAGDVGDLVRVGDGGRDAARHDRGGELWREAEGTFDVDVAVDEAGGDEGVVEVDLVTRPVAGADAGDAVGVDGDVGGFDGAGEDVDQSRVAEEQVGGDVAARGGEERGGRHRFANVLNLVGGP